MKFEGRVGPAGWRFCGHEQQKKATTHFRLSSRIVGLIRIEPKTDICENCGLNFRIRVKRALTALGIVMK
jgi:hypothetical protein